MATNIKLKYITPATLTISLNSLASGAQVKSSMVTNSNNYPGALIYVHLKNSSGGGVFGANYRFFLLRSDGTIGDDLSTSITENATHLGVIECDLQSGAVNKDYYHVFDTGVLGLLGPYWGIGVLNEFDSALAGSNNSIRYSYYVPEVQ